MKFIHVKTAFPILEGTLDEFRVDWPLADFPFLTWGPTVYEGLQKLRDIFTVKSPPNVTIVDGIMLAWLFTSVQAKALRADNESLTKRVGEFEHRLANLEQTLVSLVSRHGGDT